MPIFNRGQAILVSEPYVFALEGKSIEKFCSFCFTILENFVVECPDCVFFKYCSRECLSSDATYHSIECRLAHKYARTESVGFPSIEARMVYRACLRYMQETEDGVESCEYILGHRRTINDLMTHIQSLDQNKHGEYNEIIEEFREPLRKFIYLDHRLMFEMFNRIIINSHEVAYPLHTSVGRATYLAGSKLDHSCEIHNRYMQQFLGNRYVIVSLQDGLEIKSIGDIRIPYCPLTNNVILRRDALKKCYYFDCDCQRCVTEWATIQEGPELELLPEMIKILGPDSCTKSELTDKLKKILVLMKDLPDDNMFKFRCLTNLAYSVEDLEESVSYGLRALVAARSLYDIEILLLFLANSSPKLGWNKVNHKEFHIYFMVVTVLCRHLITTRGPQDFLTVKALRDTLNAFFKTKGRAASKKIACEESLLYQILPRPVNQLR